MALPFADEFKDGQWNSAFFDTVGDESGSIDMNVDGSITPVTFSLTAPADRLFYVQRFVGIIRDTGAIDSGGFGNNGGVPLTNGLELWYTDGNGFHRLMTNQHPIKRNVDFAAYCYDITYHDWGLGDTALAWRFTITRDGAPFRLRPGHSLYWKVQDDLTFLNAMHVRAGMVSLDKRYL